MRFPSSTELDFSAVGVQPGGRTTIRGAQDCGSGAEGKIGGDQDSIDAQGLEAPLKPPSRNRWTQS